MSTLDSFYLLLFEWIDCVLMSGGPGAESFALVWQGDPIGLDVYPALGTNVASSCGYIGPQNGAYVEIQYKDTTPKPLPKWP